MVGVHLLYNSTVPEIVSSFIALVRLTFFLNSCNYMGGIQTKCTIFRCDGYPAILKYSPPLELHSDSDQTSCF